MHASRNRLDTRSHMSPIGAKDAGLTWNVLTSKRPGLGRDLPPGKEDRAWVANSSTLIAGKRDAVLVDTFLTTDEGRTLVDWVAENGKKLTAIYVTHGHGDHFFGLAALLERFPHARALATRKVVSAMEKQLEPAALDEFWRKRFPGQIPERLVVAEALDDNEFELEGHKLVVIDTGHTDTASSTCLHVPSINLLVAGDVVYNETHVYLVETDTASRREWMATLERLEMLKPNAVVAGHKIPENDDDERIIVETHRYLRDFSLFNASTSTARELYDAMLELYPHHANPGSLWLSANTAKELARATT
jgi:glyoxylase-like metal-dependent hydrolase (beta-lactamase superfamily II)